MTDTETRADERKKTIGEIASAIEAFNWRVDGLFSEIFNKTSDDAICEIASQLIKQIAAYVRSRA